MRFTVTYKHVEGDGIFRPSTGQASGTYQTVVEAESHKEARETFEATNRNGNTIIAVEQSSVDTKAVAV